MTEAEWLAASSPEELLHYVDADAGGRKPYLFSAACLRRIWQLLPGPSSQSVAVALERCAEGERDWDALDRAREAAREEGNAAQNRIGAYAGGAASEWSPFNLADWAVEAIKCAHEEVAERGDREAQAQATLLRDVFGNPFRCVTFSPEWRTSTAVALARGMYEARDFSAMPILADSLQDAGCEDEQLLGHCRGPGPHVRGCWVVDLVLGKE